MLEQFIQQYQITFIIVIIIIAVWDGIWKLVALWKPQKSLISDGYQKSFDF